MEYLTSAECAEKWSVSQRCTGAITKDRLNALKEADAIVREEIGKLKHTPWQYFCVILAVKIKSSSFHFFFGTG